MSNLTIEKLHELKIQKENVEKAYKEACTEYAISICPHKVGDVVEVMGCSHSGKKMRVDSISFATNYFSFDKYNVTWRVSGVVLKSDGNDSKLSASFTGFDAERRSKK